MLAQGIRFGIGLIGSGAQATGEGMMMVIVFGIGISMLAGMCAGDSGEHDDEVGILPSQTPRMAADGFYYYHVDSSNNGIGHPVYY